MSALDAEGMQDDGGGAGVTELSPATSRLFRIRKTTLKMLSSRGYIVEEDKISQSAKEFLAEFPGGDVTREQLQMFLEKEDDAADQIMVVFMEDDTVGVKPIKMLTDKMQKLNATRALMVVKHNITPFAKSAIAVCQTQQKITLEVWRESELLVDITEHELVPTHEVLDDQSKAELLARYRLKPGQLPRIQHRDPVARYYGMEKGQVVKITRDSETAGRYITYRICV
jgi:DNA-directed RNA polymerase I, II, and III subunit RPABC1